MGQINRFYELVPQVQDRPGDIWRGVPSYSGYSTASIRSIVVSPACDLANCKTESLTLIPVLPIREFLTSFCSIREIVSALNEALERINCSRIVDSNPALLPHPATITAAVDEVSARSEKTGLNSHFERARAGLALLEAIRAQLPLEQRLALLQGLLGNAEFRKKTKELIHNQRLSTHFLPADDQPPEFSAVPEPSVALLRMPVSFPLEVFEMANTTPLDEWNGSVRELLGIFPQLVGFQDSQPVKLARLKPEYVSDMLTRFVSLFVRLGAPNTPVAVVEDSLKVVVGG